jgi:hypothetical protein
MTDNSSDACGAESGSNFDDELRALFQTVHAPVFAPERSPSRRNVDYRDSLQAQEARPARRGRPLAVGLATAGVLLATSVTGALLASAAIRDPAPVVQPATSAPSAEPSPEPSPTSTGAMPASTTRPAPPVGVLVPRCRPLTGDWDGAGRDSIGVACVDGDTWSFELRSAPAGPAALTGVLARANDCLPVTGDWDGDGHDTIGVVCREGASLVWSLVDGLDGPASYPPFEFGDAGRCWPVTGDWNGDGRDGVGVACHDGIEISWALTDELAAGPPSYPVFGYGNADECRPVVGDWDGDHHDGVGVACRRGVDISYGLLNPLTNGAPSVEPFDFGNAAECDPVTGDFDGDGRASVGVACRQTPVLAWGLMNIQAGGSPQVTADFGAGGTYRAEGGWRGPHWPGWPE